MKRCRTCTHWEQITKFDNVANVGRCKMLPDYEKMEIIIEYGWEGGYIDRVEVSEDFGCVLHEKKQ